MLLLIVKKLDGADPESGIATEIALVDGATKIYKQNIFNATNTPPLCTFASEQFVIAEAGSLNGGAHTLTIRITNGAGLQSSVDIPFTIIADTTPPVITITSPSAEEIFDFHDTIPIGWTATDPESAVTSQSATLDGSEVEGRLASIEKSEGHKNDR